MESTFPDQAARTSDPGSPSPRLLLGPMLRFVDDDSATIWVETDRPCRVTVHATRLAASAGAAPDADTTRAESDTWTVHSHHFALVVLSGLEPGYVAHYTVRLDDTLAWPDPALGLPASVIRTFDAAQDFRLAFGSCRRSAGDSEQDLRRFGADALVALSRRMQETAFEDWPDALFCGGDQVYADMPSPEQRDRLLARHEERSAVQSSAESDLREVADEIQTFEEYTWLYHDSWGRRDVRWLFSTVPTVMLLDDHDLRDDWNTSQAWRDTVTAKPWWRERVVGAFASYWVYQHLGNLSPAELERDGLFQQLCSTADDAERDDLVDAMAWRADADPETTRWSIARRFSTAEVSIKLVAVDARCSRVLAPARRAMLDEAELQWFRDQLAEPVDHLLIGTTLPYLMVPGIHHLEGWNEALAAGRYGGLVARMSEAVRQKVDLEHWAAFRGTFSRVATLLDEVVAAEVPPASLLLLSGDVHCSYVATGSLPRQDPDRTGFHQLTMSPFRNPLEPPIRLANRLLGARPVRRLLRWLATRAGVARVPVDWEIGQGLWFDNGVMTVVLDGRTARVEVEHAHVVGRGQVLRRTASIPLTPASQAARRGAASAAAE